MFGIAYVKKKKNCNANVTRFIAKHSQPGVNNTTKLIGGDA